MARIVICSLWYWPDNCTVITIVNYDRKTFTAQASGLVLIMSEERLFALHLKRLKELSSGKRSSLLIKREALSDLDGNRFWSTDPVAVI